MDNPEKFVDPKSKEYCEQFHRLKKHPLNKYISPVSSKERSILFRVSNDDDKRMYVVRGITRPLKNIFFPAYSYTEKAPVMDMGTRQFVEMLKSNTALHDLSYDGLKNRFLTAENGSSCDTDNGYDIVYTDGLGTKVGMDGKRVFAGKGKGKGKGKDGRSRSRRRASKRRPMTYREMIGLKRGKEVHDQTEYYVKNGMEQLFHKYREPHPMLDQIIKQLWIHKLVPVQSEYPIFHPKLFIGTNVDMVCRDEKGRMVFVELKTGDLNSMCGYYKKMESPFKDITDNRMWQAVLQVKLAALLVEKIYSLGHVRSVVIVVENDNGITIDVDERIKWFNERESQFLSTFSNISIERNFVGTASEFFNSTEKKKSAKRRNRSNKKLRKKIKMMLKRQRPATSDNEDSNPLSKLYNENDNDDDESSGSDFEPSDTDSDDSYQSASGDDKTYKGKRAKKAQSSSEEGYSSDSSSSSSSKSFSLDDGDGSESDESLDEDGVAASAHLQAKVTNTQETIEKIKKANAKNKK